jgi:UDP-N-acetylmuramate dehydrogenase
MFKRDFPLKKYNTFGLDYKAEYFVSLKSEDDVIRFLNEGHAFKSPWLILGGGSNILFTEDFKGTILHPEKDEITVEEIKDDTVIVSAWAGTNWDRLVEWSVEKGFCGLENLSLIPGSAGATPVQNIGAYGIEARDVILKVKAININNGKERYFSNDECRFGYRDSIFKHEEKGNYLITRVYYKLNINQIYSLNYGSLEQEVNRIGSINLRNIRQAVINIRQSKLPDPGQIGNAGSFFKNPVVTLNVAEELKKQYPGMPQYDDISGNIKLAAGWMIEKCGWKGRRTGDAGVHEKQALVIVNYGKATGRQIYDLSVAVKKSVFEKFGIELDREVEIAGPI